MIISDLNYIEATEKSSIEGGLAVVISPAPSGVLAQGPNFAGVLGTFNAFAVDDGVTSTAGMTFIGGALAF